MGCQALLQGNLPDTGIEPGSPPLQMDSLPFRPPGKPSIGTRKPKKSHDQSCDIGFIAVAWNRSGDLSEACLCVPKCSCPREAFYTTSSGAIVLLYIRECFPWQVKDEIWEQEGSGLPTTSLLHQNLSASLSASLVRGHRLPFSFCLQSAQSSAHLVTISET